MLLATGLLLFTLLRGLRAPNAYALGHWFFSYDLGIWRRAFIGSLFRPWWPSLSPQTAVYVIFAGGLAVALALLAIVWWLTWRSTRRGRALPGAALTLLACATAPSLVFAVHSSAYLDGFVFLLGAIATTCASRGSPRALLLCALCNAIGPFVHEIYAVVALPAVAFAFCVHGALAPARRWPGRLGQAAAILAPGVISWVAVAWQPLFAGERYVALVAAFTRNRVVSLGDNHTLFYTFTTPFAENWHKMLAGWRALGWSHAIWLTLPYLWFGWLVAALGAIALPAAGVHRRRRWALVALLVIVPLLPLLLHLMAWDLDRTSSYTGMTALLCLLALLRTADHVRASASAAPSAFTAFALLVIALNLTGKIRLLDGSRAEIHSAVLSRLPAELARLRLPAPFVRKRAPLFPNADFEAGDLRNWTAAGEAFAAQPTCGDTPISRGKMAVPEGRFWIGTFEHDPRGDARTCQGDGPQGVLTSAPFVVAGDRLVFLVGGGADLATTYVSFHDAAGQELARFAGENNELMRQVVFDVSRHRGRHLTVRIVDAASGPWGHVNADDFGWAP
jgi:hypothetical protein